MEKRKKKKRNWVVLALGFTSCIWIKLLCYSSEKHFFWIFSVACMLLQGIKAGQLLVSLHLLSRCLSFCKAAEWAVCFCLVWFVFACSLTCFWCWAVLYFCWPGCCGGKIKWQNLLSSGCTMAVFYLFCTSWVFSSLNGTARANVLSPACLWHCWYETVACSE